MKKYIEEAYESNALRNIVEQGCVNGAASIHIYYKDTIAFHDEFEEEIWNLVDGFAEDQGVSALEFISSLNGHKMVGGIDQLKNLLCWWAIEETAREILEVE